MSINTITAYKTSDGKIFESQPDAREHELDIDFAVWYNKDPIGKDVDVTQVRDWLDDNREQILAYLK
jgi:hypothetical protein